MSSFCANILAQKITSQTLSGEKLAKTLLKGECKVLVKLKLGVNFINSFRAAFAAIYLHQKFSKPNCN